MSARQFITVLYALYPNTEGQSVLAWGDAALDPSSLHLNTNRSNPKRPTHVTIAGVKIRVRGRALPAPVNTHSISAAHVCPDEHGGPRLRITFKQLGVTA